jgi:hypothetical protein
MRSAGYYLADRNDNPFCGHCSEVVFLHAHAYGINGAIAVGKSQQGSIQHRLNVPSLFEHARHTWISEDANSMAFKQHSIHHSTRDDDVVAYYEQAEIKMENCSSFSRSNFKPCNALPQKNILWEALRLYGRDHLHASSLRLADYTKDNTLLVHLCAVDFGPAHAMFSKMLKSLIATYAFDEVVIFTDIRHRTRHHDEWSASCLLQAALREAFAELQTVRVSYHIPDTPDNELYHLHTARNLLVHRGSFSALAAWACQGRVFIPEDMIGMYNSNFTRSLSNAHILFHNGTVTSILHASS